MSISSAPASGASTSRLMVSGIGRSGTTLLYQQLAKLIVTKGLTAQWRYEPYLWNIQTPAARGNPFGMEQLHHFGLHVHTATPLFLGAEGTDLHSAFLDHLFAGPTDVDTKSMPDVYLTKVIRASGRLRHYLSRFPDLKIVACLRNPVDTINSSLGMFSFFGEEFHASDRGRFQAETQYRSPGVYVLPEGRNSVEWTAAWVDAFTRETLAVASEYPDRVMPFCYEAFQADPDGMLKRLQDFVGIHNEGVHMGLSEPAGPKIKATSLTASDLSLLEPFLDTYQKRVMTPALGSATAGRMAARIFDRYAAGRFTLPLAGTGTGRMSSLQLRRLLMDGRDTPHLRLASRAHSSVDLRGLIEKHNGEPARLCRPCPNPATIKGGLTFGAVVINHNNGGAAVDAVLSLLNQTLPFDQIVVVDDRSSDGSLQLLQTLAEQYASVTVIPLTNNIGPSGARHVGIARLTTDYVTQLDGDDLFWPTKLAHEVRALAGQLNRVAFSDILLVDPAKSVFLSTAAYGGEDELGTTSQRVFSGLLRRTRQIPRDMLIPRWAYFAAGGYDLRKTLYEDWDFKLRLASVPELTWHYSGEPGTVYNRLIPGLSGQHPGHHARALILIFLAALPRAHDLSPETILDAYDSALAPHADRALTRHTRDWLKDLLSSGNFDAEALAAFARARRVNACSNEELRHLMTRMSQGTPRLTPHQVVASGRRVIEFAASNGETAGTLAPGSDIYFQLSTPAPCPGFEIEFAAIPAPQELLVELSGQRHAATVPPAVEEGGQPRIRVPLPLEAGRSIVRLRSAPKGPPLNIAGFITLSAWEMVA